MNHRSSCEANPVGQLDRQVDQKREAAAVAQASRRQVWTPVRLTAEEAAAMAQLERSCFTLPWSEEQIRAAFGQKTFAASGLHEDGRLVAYLSVYLNPDELEILNIAVEPERRRQGCARVLLGAALRAAQKNGINRAVLEVRPGNAPALGLYASFGFRPVGRRRRYYRDTGEDALILACPLVAEEGPSENQGQAPASR